MNNVVRLRLIGSEEAVKVVEEFLQGELSTVDACFVIDDRRYRSRRDPAAVRAYAEILLPSYLFDEGAR
ncbi:MULTISPECIES: hypothetical protein [unclassified Nocardia]|uniref:hypothetical protein n=1 Tax=unclassified Nocardia TaxID=2637762 RepID=UPI001CE4398E|nr:MULTISPECIES: hypothetical protein [unclassified Nocardia]